MFPLTQWMYYFLICITGTYCFIDFSCCPWSYLENPGDGRFIWWWCCGSRGPSDPHFPLFLVLYQRDLLALPPNTTISAVTPLSIFLENKNINKDRGLGRGWMIFQNIYQTWPAPQTKPRARQTRAAKPGFPGFGWRTCIIYQQLLHFLNCELQN